MAEHRTVVATVTGRVQGVGYRYAVLRMAEEFGLRGWVRNAPDGTVEVWAQGDSTVLQEVITFLGRGPRSARVESVVVRSAEPDTSITGFTVRS